MKAGPHHRCKRLDSPSRRDLYNSQLTLTYLAERGLPPSPLFHLGQETQESLPAPGIGGLSEHCRQMLPPNIQSEIQLEGLVE